VLCAISIAANAAAQSNDTRAVTWRTVLALSDAEQVAFVNSYLNSGQSMPNVEGEALNSLAASRSALVLPIIERKIEEVLKSANPEECFTSTGVDPQMAVSAMALAITYAGDEQSLKQISKLLKLDEKLFGGLIPGTLSHAINLPGNPFLLAYKGFDLGNPAVDSRIAEWAQGILAQPSFDMPGSIRVRWAEALVERYGAVPVEAEWINDPIVSRLTPALAQTLHGPMYRLATAAWERRTLPSRMLAMSEAEQIAITRTYLDNGVPPEQRDAVMALVRNRSSVVLSVIERKIEEIVKSPNPIDCFTVKTVNPEVALGGAALAIAEAGDDEALKQASKLVKFAGNRLPWLVGAILNAAKGRGDAFPLAYKGLEMGDPVLEKQISAWLERTLAEPAMNVPGDARHEWAAAMAHRYGGTPTPAQWMKDPIASRLKPAIAESVRDEVLRFAATVAQQQTRK
jgi:hypothetical protein